MGGVVSPVLATRNGGARDMCLIATECCDTPSYREGGTAMLCAAFSPTVEWTADGGEPTWTTGPEWTYEVANGKAEGAFRCEPGEPVAGPRACEDPLRTGMNASTVPSAPRAGAHPQVLSTPQRPSWHSSRLPWPIVAAIPASPIPFTAGLCPGLEAPQG